MKRAIVIGWIAAFASTAPAQSWVAPMRQVRQAYTDGDGEAKGAIGRFGDSISVSKASFYPLSWNWYSTAPGTPERDALTWLRGWMTAASWGWQDDDQGLGGPVWDDFKFHGCLGGTRSTWPLELCESEWTGRLAGERRVDYWLRNDNPEIAVIMWGSNDLGDGSISVATYKNSMRQVIQACKANGTIPVLMTAPPRTNYDSGTGSNLQKAIGFHQAMVDLAAEQQVPLVDFHDEITTRRPHNLPTDTWDGANDMWSSYSGYQVPTLMARDGLHPSNWSAGGSAFDQSSLNTNGFTLRNYMTLMAVQEVFDMVIDPTPPCHIGDANRDGRVGIADLAALADNYGTTVPATWEMGDFTLDAAVGIADLVALADNYGWVGSPCPAGGAVPEPATLAQIAVGALTLVRRRR